MLFKRPVAGVTCLITNKVNLIDQKGGEKRLESTFSDIVNQADNKMIK